MPSIAPVVEQIRGYCALCISRCGSIATVQDGRFVELDADPDHPTGKAFCIKGRAAPELVYHPERLLYPMRRTRPKGDRTRAGSGSAGTRRSRPPPSGCGRSRSEHGPESVAFASASPSTSAIVDALDWMTRLRRAFGSPNFCMSMELCGWGRYMASSTCTVRPFPARTCRTSDRAGCILFWGYNPSASRIAHAAATAAALQRGARLIVVDPRDAGMAKKSDLWLRVRPGTDGALALGIAHVMIERGWFDAAFVRDWTNAPLLVRSDNGRLLKQSDLVPQGDPKKFIAWSEQRGEARRRGAGQRPKMAVRPAWLVPSRSRPLKGPSSAQRSSSAMPNCAASTSCRGSRRFAAFLPSRSFVPPNCYGIRGRSRSTRGAVSSSIRMRRRRRERSGRSMR